MKRFSLILLALMMLFALALGACGDDDDDNDDNDVADDDDATDDDDVTDDDVADDDVTDDDVTDDDVADDDVTDDDVTDDDVTDDDVTDDDVTDDDDDDDFSDNFESYTIGSPPSAPWEADLTDCTANVVALTKDGSGKGVELNDPSDSAVGGIGVDLSSLPFFNTATFTLSWDWLWESGDGMSMQVLVDDTGTYYQQLAVDFYVDHIEAFYSGGWLTCATGTNYDQWYHFDVVINPVAETFTVYIDGTESSCSGLAFYYQGYSYGIQGMQFLMYSDVNGGSTLLDNVEVSEN